jgi:hypothetical protein
MRFVTLLLGLAISGCGAIGFDLPIELREQHIEGSVLGGVLGGVFEVPIPLDIDLQAETQARDTGPAQHVRLAALTLSITTTDEPSGDTDDFAFIDGVEIWVESAQSGSSLPRTRVAELGPVPDGAREISFTTDESVDLLPYINEGARLTSSAQGTQPDDDVSFDGVVMLSVEVL